MYKLTPYFLTMVKELCTKVPNLEWFAILFYKELEENVFSFEALLPMHIGSAVDTNFEYQADLAAFLLDNPEYALCRNGLIHSHHTMQTNFSSTDTTYLKKGADIADYFISVVVNNAGQMTAKKAMKIITASYVKKTSYTVNRVIKTTEVVIPEQTEIIIEELRLYQEYAELPQWFTDKTQVILDVKAAEVKTAYSYGGWTNFEEKYNNKPFSPVKHKKSTVVVNAVDINAEQILCGLLNCTKGALGAYLGFPISLHVQAKLDRLNFNQQIDILEWLVNHGHDQCHIANYLSNMSVD